jgi:hypothetical protein
MTTREECELFIHKCRLIAECMVRPSEGARVTPFTACSVIVVSPGVKCYIRGDPVYDSYIIALEVRSGGKVPPCMVDIAYKWGKMLQEHLQRGPER